MRPDGEDFWAWFGTGIADTVNMFAIEKFTFAILVYPIYMLVSDLIIIFNQAFRKKRQEIFYFLSIYKLEIYEEDTNREK